MDRSSSNTKERQVWSYVTGEGSDTIWRPKVLLNRSYNGKTLKTFYAVSIYADSQKFQGRFFGGRYFENLADPDAYMTRLVLWASASRNRADSKTTVFRAYLCDLDEDGKPAPPGTIIRFEKYKDVFNGDEKLIHSMPVVTGNVDAARSAVEHINAFPNPYYAVNLSERSRSGKFIKFQHLPQVATIRIFNIAGVLVKTIFKDDPSQVAQWDLLNENGLPVASSIYIAHFELHDVNGVDLGTKVLKLMIVQEQQIK